MEDVRLKREGSDLCCRAVVLLFLFEELIIQYFPNLLNCNGRYFQILAVDYINRHPIHSSSSEYGFFWLGVLGFFYSLISFIFL